MEPEPTSRKSVTLPTGMWEAIDGFRFDERIGSQAEAIRRIMLAGLRAVGAVDAKEQKVKGRPSGHDDQGGRL